MTERLGQKFRLPSLGKAYGDLLPDGEIEIFAMKTTEEKLFTGLTKAQDFENVIDTLIARCTSLPKELKPADLLTGDRVFLMMFMRAVSYGNYYGFQARCGMDSCHHKWDQTIDLTRDLEIKELDACEPFEDPFEIELPDSNDRVKLRLFRGRDERRVLDYVDRQSRKVDIRKQGDPAYLYRLALHVVGVVSEDPKRTFGGEGTDPGETLADALVWVEKLVAPDSSAIREELEARTPGIVLSVEYDCPRCGENQTMPLPVSASFFRTAPSARVHTRTRTVSVASR